MSDHTLGWYSREVYSGVICVFWHEIYLFKRCPKTMEDQTNVSSHEQWHSFIAKCGGNG